MAPAITDDSPIVAKFAKYVPFTRPRSTCSACPCAITATAAATSSRGMPSDCAKLLPVPNGSTPSVLSRCASSFTACVIVPSPPPTRISGVPAFTARRISSRQPLSVVCAWNAATRSPCASSAACSASI